MFRAGRRFATTYCLVAVVLSVALCQTVRAGSNGSVNGVGVGSVWSSVTSSTGNSNFAQVVLVSKPGANMSNAPTAGFTTNGVLPSGSSSATFSWIKGGAGGIQLKGTNHAVHADGANNGE